MKKLLIGLLLLTLGTGGTLLNQSQNANVTLASEEEDPQEIPFELRINGETKELTLEDLGVRVHKKSKYYFTWNASSVEENLRALWNIDHAKNAHFTFKEGQLSMEAEVDGEIFEDLEDTLEEITDDYPKFDIYSLKTSETNLITANDLMPHFQQVQTLLTDGLTVTVQNDNFKFPAQIKDLVFKLESNETSMSLGAPFLNYVSTTLQEHVDQEKIDLTVFEADLSQITLATTEGRVQDGRYLITDTTRTLIESGIENGETTVTGLADFTLGQVINKTGKDLGPLTHIATGVSNFESYNEGRNFNVRKALNEHYSNLVIPAGAEFAFNSFLGPVTYSAGWEGSLAIFGGTNLRKVPGGGICQVSTTMYRAALDAGLEIKKQYNHSLYVHYYEQESSYEGVEGAGLDSTIFPGVKDLIFVNNTPNPILIEAYDDGFDAVVKFYGENDGRSTSLEGPFTQSNQTQELIDATGGLTLKQIAWKYRINKANGESITDWLISTYLKYNVEQY
ncbi:VanW family protein [Candidatus Peregrinibacteria bacterium]|jgi:vancomycin resistance protein YoaR|nr:VanW family protein [Candidatus Peregrinibacteria bacterium]MBT4632087.1 VanW family protein [Candidatus Peregrinibacteria bacterium]MBT5516601.1 VanW family protein [Candidatus Peregrinibacteria bacterium]MBT5823505.1 VanW family protein [Candidatus Peregrinibacteria bacterium]